jgi:hypothetical protein
MSTEPSSLAGRNILCSLSFIEYRVLSICFRKRE